MFEIPGIMTTLKMDIRDFQQNVKLAIKEAGSITKSLNDAVKETTSMGAVMGTAGAAAATSMKEVTKSTAEMTSVTKAAAAATTGATKSMRDLTAASVQSFGASARAGSAMAGVSRAATSVAAAASVASVEVQSFATRAGLAISGLAAKAQAARTAISGFLAAISSGALAFGAAGAALLGFSGNSLRMAASVQESENLFEVSMGAMADSVRAWSEDVAEATGTADFEIRRMVGTFNVMLKSMGFADEASVSMSKNMTMLANDLASFYNLPIDEAFTKISAGISGETEPLKRLGILIDEASVKAFAAANGIGELGRELTNGEKITARYGLIMEATSAAQGDLVRTADSATNQWRRLTGQTAQLSASLGNQILPAMNDLVMTGNRVIAVLIAWSRANPELTQTIMKVALGTGAALSALAAISFVAPSVVGAFRAIALAAGIAWTAILSGPALVIAALASIVISAKVLYDQFNISFPGAAKAVGDFVDWSIDKLNKLISTAGSVIGWAKTVGSSVSDALGTSMDMNGQTVFSDGAKKAAASAGTEAGESFGTSLMESLKNYVSTGSDMLKSALGGIGSMFGTTGLGDAIKDALNYDPVDVDALMAEFKNGIDAAGGAAAKAAEKLQESGESLFRSLRKDVDLLASATESLNELKAAGHLSDDTLNLLGRDFWQKFGSDATGQIDAAITGMQAMGGEMGTLANAMRAAQEQARIDELKPQGIALDLQLNPQDDLLQQTRADLESLAAAEKLTEQNALALGVALSGSLGDLNEIQIADFTEQLRALNGEMGDVAAQGLNMGRTEAQSTALDAMLAQIDPLGSALDDLRGKIEMAAEAGVIDDHIGNLLAEDIWNTLKDTAFSTMEEIENALGTKLPAAIKKPLETTVEEAKKVDKIGKMKEAQQGIASLGNAISSLGGKWKTVGDVFAAVQATMQIATGIMEKSISGVISGVGGLILLLGQLTKKAPEELKGIAKVMDEIKQASDEWISSISDALLDFAKEGKAAWGELVEQIFDDIFKIAAAELLVKPIVNFGGSMLGFAKGGAFDGGRVVPFAKGGHVTEGPEFFPMAYGKTGVRGEAGREGVLPLERMANGDLGVQANMSRGDDRTIINIHDNRQHGEAVQVRESRTGDGRKQLDIFIADALGRLARSGDLDGIMGSRYGLQGRPA